MYKAVGRIVLIPANYVCIFCQMMQFSLKTRKLNCTIMDMKLVRTKNKGKAMHLKAGICLNYFTFIPVIFFF